MARPNHTSGGSSTGLPPMAVYGCRRRSSRGGIVAATNDALSMATGEFVALPRPRRRAAPRRARAQWRPAIDDHDDVDYVYTDEDKVDLDGRHFDPFLKPDWSPERLRCQMYTAPSQRDPAVAGRRSRRDARGLRRVPGLGPRVAGHRTGTAHRARPRDPLPLASGPRLGRRRPGRQAVGARGRQARRSPRTSSARASLPRSRSSPTCLAPTACGPSSANARW